MTENSVAKTPETNESLKTANILLVEREKNLKEIEVKLTNNLDTLVAHMSSLRSLPADIQKMITASTKVVGETLKGPIKTSLEEDISKLKEEVSHMTELLQNTSHKMGLFEKKRVRKTLIIAVIAFSGCVCASCFGVWVMFRTNPPLQIIKNVENLSVVSAPKLLGREYLQP